MSHLDLGLADLGARHDMMVHMKATTGQKLRAARLEAGLTQDALARLTGLSQNNISNAESGRYWQLSERKLAEILASVYAYKARHERLR